MKMHLIAPTFPFSHDDVIQARDFRNTLAELLGLYGPAMKDWEDLEDTDFQKSLAIYWAFIFGRAPTRAETPAKMVTDVLRVTDEHFDARIKTGAVPS
jgi:hypothetical protein